MSASPPSAAAASPSPSIAAAVPAAFPPAPAASPAAAGASSASAAGSGCHLRSAAVESAAAGQLGPQQSCRKTFSAAADQPT